MFVSQARVLQQPLGALDDYSMLYLNSNYEANMYRLQIRTSALHEDIEGCCCKDVPKELIVLLIVDVLIHCQSEVYCTGGHPLNKNAAKSAVVGELYRHPFIFF